MRNLRYNPNRQMYGTHQSSFAIKIHLSKLRQDLSSQVKIMVLGQIC